MPSHMLKFTRSWFYVSLFVALMILPGCEQSSIGVKVGDKAPEITGDDVDGKRISLSQYQGKVVLLDFWATWCPPCRKEIPNELALHREFSGKPFAILGISRDSSREDLKNFLDQSKLPWPNILDSSNSIADQWKLRSIPVVVLIDPNGVILAHWTGSGHIDEIRSAVTAAVSAAEKK